MDLPAAPDLAPFREEVRRFIRASLPADIRRRVARQEPLDRESHTRWQKILLQRGWAAPAWPLEHGGTGWTLDRQYVFEQELAANDAPRMIYFGLDMVGPTLMTHGSEVQRRHFLPPILSGDLWWCQGFSEPGAGSDLAALQCKAVRDGDEYVVNGSKMWTSIAQDADWMFGLFRTAHEPKKQLGITLLLIDMRSPGISIQPIITFDGAHEVNQTFFDNVRTSVANRVGEEGKGWGLAKFMLGLERLGIAEVARTKAMLARLKRIAAVEPAGGTPVGKDPLFAARISAFEIDLLALEAAEHHFLFGPGDEAGSGVDESLLKIRGSELQQLAAELTVEALGERALPDVRPADEQGTNEPPVGPAHAALAASTYFNLRKLSSLRRLQRDPEEHHRQGCARPLTNGSLLGQRPLQ